MARIRSIKPDYWKSEKLAARLPGSDGREARRLFVGLWNLAEDHGVSRGNPSYIRAELYPYDEDVTTKDVSRWLGLLEVGGFIVRFIRDNSTYLWIRGFGDHQRIEKPSKPSLPAPTDGEMRCLPDHSGRTPGGLREDSPTTPGGLPVGGGGGREVEKEVEVEGTAALPLAEPDSVEALQRFWNEHAPAALARWKAVTKDRRKTVLARLKEHTLSELCEAIRRLHGSAFLSGTAPGKDWRADIDWVLKPGNVAKLLEGKWQDREPSPPEQPADDERCEAGCGRWGSRTEAEHRICETCAASLLRWFQEATGDPYLTPEHWQPWLQSRTQEAA